MRHHAQVRERLGDSDAGRPPGPSAHASAARCCRGRHGGRLPAVTGRPGASVQPLQAVGAGAVGYRDLDGRQVGRLDVPPPVEQRHHRQADAPSPQSDLPAPGALPDVYPHLGASGCQHDPLICRECDRWQDRPSRPAAPGPGVLMDSADGPLHLGRAVERRYNPWLTICRPRKRDRRGCEGPEVQRGRLRRMDRHPLEQER